MRGEHAGGRKEPNVSTLITLLLLLLLCLPLIFAGGYLLRDAPVRRMRLRGRTPRPAAGDYKVGRAFEVLGQARLEAGNLIEPLENGDQLFPRLLEDLARAERLITWQVYWFKPGALADRIADALLERAGAGVDVLMLIDAFGASGLSRAYVERLRDGGVNVRWYRPLRVKSLYKYPHRSHVRSVVIDARIGYTGGFGIDDRWMGDGRSPGRWRDTHVRIEGPIVDQLQGPFISNWAETTGELLLGEAVMEASRVASGDDQRAAVMYGAPSLGSTNAERLVALTIAAARETLYIASAYFVPNRGFRGMLCKAASEGVDVRVLTPGRNTDQMSTYYAGRARYEELLRGGVRIYEYRPTMMHAKTFVADRVWLSIGSINFDNRSLKLNDEVSLVAQSAQLGHALHDMFLRDLEYASEVKLEDFRRRSVLDRSRERAAWLISSLL